MRPLASAIALGAVTLLLARGAHADDKAACRAAYDATQELRAQGRLGEARARALACTRDACAEFVRLDCARWAEEIKLARPSLVLVVRDVKGDETASVRVSLDGKPWLEKLDGKATPLDPGAHRLVFDLAGAPPIERAVLAREGEQRRRITVSFEPPRTAAPRADAANVASGVPTWAWVSGGIGAGALLGAVGAVAGWASAKSAYSDHCGPTTANGQCTGPDASAVTDDKAHERLFGGLAIGLGATAVIGLGFGVYGLTRRQGRAAPPPLALTPSVSPTFAGLVARRDF